MESFNKTWHTNKCYVYFAFDGDDFNLSEITQILDIQPTKTTTKGQKRANKSQLKYSSTSWQLSTEKVVNEIIDVSEMASSLIQLLRPKTNLINNIRKKYQVSTRLEVVLYITYDQNQTTPILNLNTENINFLAQVGACFDVDIYRIGCVDY